MVVLYILLFIVCLSSLIMIHEAGHLAAAKIFKVYCFDYSIGFGPALLHKKRKNGETYFSIRAIPFGGFVSMYGEGKEEELPEGVENIPIERSLNHIKKWKRAIVLSAGVIMNAFLSIVLFFIAACLPQENLYLRYIDVKEDSVAYNSGLTNETNIYFYLHGDSESEENAIKEAEKINCYYLDFSSLVTYEDDSTQSAATLFDASKISFKYRDYNRALRYFLTDDGVINYQKEITKNTKNVKSITLNISNSVYDTEAEEWKKGDNTYSLVINNSDDGFESIGLSVLLVRTRNSFGGVFKETFSNFGNSSLLIFKSIGGLFVGKGWENVGGIVSIYSQSTAILQNYNVSFFIQVWAIISVNLAIFNLFPFPGLDGWQLLVLAVEAIAHKEIPQKVKGIVSIVGVALLVVLMVLVLIKDVIGLF